MMRRAGSTSPEDLGGNHCHCRELTMGYQLARNTANIRVVLVGRYAWIFSSSVSKGMLEVVGV